jgi:hypothetical protein
MLVCIGAQILLRLQRYASYSKCRTWPGDPLSRGLGPGERDSHIVNVRYFYDRVHVLRETLNCASGEVDHNSIEEGCGFSFIDGSCTVPLHANVSAAGCCAWEAVLAASPTEIGGGTRLDREQIGIYIFG